MNTGNTARNQACFVYLAMPHSLEVVTCGRFVQEALPGGEVTGRFVYDPRYRVQADAIPLDPVHLPISEHAYESASLGGNFGAFRDAAPDAWGRLVIERVLGRTDLSELDFLLESPDDRAGALSFGRGEAPPARTWRHNQIVQLPQLLEAARLLDDDPDGATLPRELERLQQIVEPRTSVGGARPKNVVEDDEGLWIAKFPAKDDRWTNATVEAAMLSLAGRCGIQVPPTRIERVGGESVLLVKRFDREKSRASGGESSAPSGGPASEVLDDAPDQRYLRHRMVSVLTVLGAEVDGSDRESWSYLTLADELGRWSSRVAADRVEIFRRMVFNSLISNTDDHPRNHALIAPGHDWQLSPAYDLTPDPLPGRHDRNLALICGQHGRAARRANLVSHAHRFALSRDDALAIIDAMKEIVSTGWEDELRRQGGTAADAAAIATAFVDEGFEYSLDD